MMHDQIDRIPNGDIIIHAGDCTSNGHSTQIEEFLRWYGSLNFKKKIMIAGNHDWCFERGDKKYENMCKKLGITYLQDSGCTYKGIKFWGSPVSPEFNNWAFNRSRTLAQSMSEKAQRNKHAYIGNHWDKIPEDIDILITHTPPSGIMDSDGTYPLGCHLLYHKVQYVKPLLHVFGHIHTRGVRVERSSGCPITYCNASMVDYSFGRYTPFNDEPHVFSWDKLLKGSSKGRD